MSDYLREEIEEISTIYEKFTFKARDIVDKVMPPIIDEVWFTGSGDSHCASLFGASLFNQLGIPARAFAPMELSNFHAIPSSKNICLIAISVSGKTPRVREIAKKFHQICKKGIVIGITDNPASPLFKEVDVPILLFASPEHTLQYDGISSDVLQQYDGYQHPIAQTKTYFANILWIIALSALWDKQTPCLLEQLSSILSPKHLVNWIKESAQWASINLISFPMKTIFVGSGLFFSLAQFGQYKWFEYTFSGLKQDIEEYAHTHYFVTDEKTSLCFFAPSPIHMTRIEELLSGALENLIKPEIYLILGADVKPLNGEMSSFTKICRLSPSPTPHHPLLKELVNYLYSMAVIFWLTYYTARNAGLDTNKFRGGVEVEKYMQGSLATVRNSKIQA